MLKLAASLELGSEHPLSGAIVESTRAMGLKISIPEDFAAITGKGVTGRIGGESVVIGNKRLFDEMDIAYSMLIEKIAGLENEAKTTVLVSVDRKIAGAIAIADSLKDDSKKTLEDLKKMGLTLVMLTGDNERTAKAIAKKVGIEKVVANILPQDKQKAIKRLQREYGSVVMVGDGVNDAPALTQANVGVAIGTGTDITIESSDVTLVQDSLSGLVTAIAISKTTFKKIKQNFFWALFYNVVAIPLAVLGLLHPLIAEIAMAASSINVVTNSLRLRRVIESKL
ncbi:MAG: HAD-IC family P-type ATPase [candidate division WOR-3 bacterium]